jgi:hypothetical protein
MVRRGVAFACAAFVAAFAVQAASADPSNAKNSTLITAICGGQQVQVVVNGNGPFTAGHVENSTSVFVPTALDVTFSFTPTGGTTQTFSNMSEKHNQKASDVTCTIPLALNTFTSPDGTFSISGTATGFFTPSNQ